MKKISFFCIAGLVLLNGASLTGKRKKQKFNILTKKTSQDDTCKNYCFIVGTTAFNFVTAVLALQSTSCPVLNNSYHFNYTQ